MNENQRRIKNESKQKLLSIYLYLFMALGIY